MIDFPGTKINLGLRITHVLDNGYHALESIFIPTSFSDVLEVIPAAESTSFFYHGIKIPGDPKNNLIYKAWKLLSKDYSIPPIEVHLLKTIPMGAGLGGGSADGSAMLKILNEMFQLGINVKELQTYAKMLGADCPFFIENSPAYVEGIGDKLSAVHLNLSAYHLLILCPGIHINTREAFENIETKIPEDHLINIINTYPIGEWRSHVFNDFEDFAFHMHPELEDIKEALYNCGALYASMSGSGSSIYGIFDKKIELDESLKSFVHHWHRF
jgi:4-diphosphocytidyl-2-C-methyl-D-erythritol kinase